MRDSGGRETLEDDVEEGPRRCPVKALHTWTLVRSAM